MNTGGDPGEFATSQIRVSKPDQHSFDNRRHDTHTVREVPRPHMLESMDPTKKTSHRKYRLASSSFLVRGFRALLHQQPGGERLPQRLKNRHPQSRSVVDRNPNTTGTNPKPQYLTSGTDFFLSSSNRSMKPRFQRVTRTVESS